jgi:hypothetical protein
MINFNVSEMPVLGLLVMILLVVLIAVFVGPGRLARNVVLGERTPPDFVVVIGRGRSTDRPRVEEGGEPHERLCRALAQEFEPTIDWRALLVLSSFLSLGICAGLVILLSA